MTEESRLVVTIDGREAERQAKSLEGSLDRLGKAGDEAAASVKGVGDGADAAGSKMSLLKGFASGLLGTFASLGGIELGRKFVDVAVQTDKLRGQLETMVGSADKAALAFKALEGFAARTPFSLDQAVEGFVKLKALGLDPTERALTSFGNTSAAMGTSLTQMIEAVADASTGEFERLREFGIKSSAEGDRVKFTFRGVTTEVGKNAAEIQKYLTELGENNFGDAMANQMAGLPGLMSNLSDEVDSLFRALGDGGAAGGLKTTIKDITDMVRTIKDFLVPLLAKTRNEFLSLFGAIDEGVVRAKAGFDLLVLGMKALANPFKSYREEMDAVRGKRDAEVASIRERTAEMKAETIAGLEAIDTTGVLSESTVTNTAATESNSKAQAKLARELKNANDRREEMIDELEFELRALKLTDRERETEIALRRLGAGATQEQIARTRELVGTIYDEQKALADLEASSEASERARERDAQSVEGWATSYERGIERMRDSVGDFFQRMLVDGEASFSGLLDMFKALIAEMIATAAANRIMLAVGFGGASSAASAASGVASGVGGLFSAAKTGYGWLTGAGGTGFGIGSSLGNVYGGLEDALGALGIKTPGESFRYAGATGLESLGRVGLNVGAGVAGSYLASSLYSGRESTGYGSMAGGFVGSAFGPVGTFVGAAVGEAIDRALSGSDFSGKRVKLGIGTGSMVDGSDWENSRTLSSGLRVGNLTRRAGDAGLSDEQINSYLSAFDTIDATLASIARSAGATIDLSGQALPGMLQSYDGGTSGGAFFGSLAKGELRQQMQDAPAEFVRQWLDATAESFDAEVRPFLQRIDGTVEEMLGSFGAIIDIQGKYKASTEALKTLLGTDTIGLVTQQIADASRSLYQVWSDQGDAIVKFSTELADTADYAELTAMVQQRYQTEIALIGQVMGALQQIDGIFAGTIEGIRLDLMSGNDERYAYFEQQIERLAGSLATMTDPGQILDTLKQIDTLAGRSYGLLDDTQKATIGEDIIGFLDQVQADADARLNVLLSTVRADKQNEAGTVANAIQTALDGASSKMTAELEAVFAKQQQAADTLNNAANQFGGWVNYLPSTINVTFAASEVNV